MKNNRIIKIANILYSSKNEFVIDSVHLREPQTGYVNPTPKQINLTKKYDVIRAFLVGNDMYIWSEVTHNTAARSLNLKGNSNVIPLSVFLSGNKILGVQVTDFSNNTKWHHNPKIKDKIMKNKWIKLYSSSESLKDPDFISYYDEAIYGPWHEMKTASKRIRTAKKYIVYHGTNTKFDKFDTSKSTMGNIWFTSDKNEIKHGEIGAAGRGYIVKAEVTINNPAGWDEYDKLGLFELEREYDGVILPNSKNKHFTCFVWNSNQIRILNTEKV
jgi:hypothetical protein